jgi:glucuronoarabinoxylan endo-1,4-beta-xylanase
MTIDEINKAFGTGDGQLGFSILRLRVPSDTSEFSLNIPTAKLAYSMGVTIIASPWSPPAAMKTNNNIVGGRLNDTSYESYAEHLRSFVDYMSANGVPLFAISVQNEPDVTVGYESCDWNASQMLRFVKENAPVIGTKIIAPESASFNHTISDAILNDPVASANISIIGGHIYGGTIENYPLAVSKGKEVWMTEYLINSGNPPANLSIDTGWTGSMRTAKSINDCMNANMSAYIWWYIVRYYGPIADGTYATKGEITKKGYVMSQFARFIRPGFVRVNSTSNPQGLINTSAYKNGSKVVIVAINQNSNSIDQQFIVSDDTVNSITPYTTSENKNCSRGTNIILSGGSFTATLEPMSITTFVTD